MALSLEQLRSAFKPPQKTSNYYPFWKMDFGESATIRFLPDKNEDNPLGFLVEKFMHNLVINGEDKTVPCLKMYDEECPICKVSAAYYKDEGKGSVNGKKYWRKKQHIAQVLVMDDPLGANEESGENSEGKLKFVNFGFQLFSVISEAAQSEDTLDDVPFLFKGGCDFIIKRTKLGDKAKYDVGSKFARHASDLTEDEIAYVEGEMIDLSTLLPRNPGLETVEAMLEADLTGSEYDFGNNASYKANNTPKTEPAKAESAPVVKTESVAKVEPVAKTESANEYEEDADDILSIIRNRNAAAAE